MSRMIPIRCRKQMRGLYQLTKLTIRLLTTTRSERGMYEARGNNWPDHIVFSIFLKALNTKLRDLLSQQLNLPTEDASFLRIVQQIASRSSGSNYTAPANHSQHQNHRTTPINAVSTSLGERNNRRSAGLCVRCGKTGHWAKDCSVRPYNNKKFWGNGGTSLEISLKLWKLTNLAMMTMALGESVMDIHDICIPSSC